MWHNMCPHFSWAVVGIKQTLHSGKNSSVGEAGRLVVEGLVEAVAEGEVEESGPEIVEGLEVIAEEVGEEGREVIHREVGVDAGGGALGMLELLCPTLLLVRDAMEKGVDVEVVERLDLDLGFFKGVRGGEEG